MAFAEAAGEAFSADEVAGGLPKTEHGHLSRLDKSTVDMLRRWKVHQNEEKLLAGRGYAD